MQLCLFSGNLKTSQRNKEISSCFAGHNTAGFFLGFWQPCPRVSLSAISNVEKVLGMRLCSWWESSKNSINFENCFRV